MAKGKLHYSTKVDKLVRCKVDETNPNSRGCAYEHYDSKEQYEATLAVENTTVAEGHKKRPTGKGRQEALTPIILTPMPMHSWDQTDWDRFALTSYIETSDDSHNVQVTKVDDIKSVVAHKFGTPFHKLPEQLRALVEQNETSWSDPTKWTAERDYGDMYGEDSAPYLTPPAEMEDALEQWYYTQPNATDNDGVLSHVREKGFDTTDLSPIDAVKKLLREENDKFVPYVEEAQFVHKQELPIERIRFNNRYYSQIEERKPVSAISGGNVDGVLYHDRNDNSYRLLDGYHRHKWKTSRNKKKGTYLIVS